MKRSIRFVLILVVLLTALGFAQGAMIGACNSKDNGAAGGGLLPCKD